MTAAHGYICQAGMHLVKCVRTRVVAPDEVSVDIVLVMVKLHKVILKLVHAFVSERLFLVFS